MTYSQLDYSLGRGKGLRGVLEGEAAQQATEDYQKLTSDQERKQTQPSEVERMLRAK